MNGIEKIIARIESDSEAEVKAIEERAAARAAEIKKAGDTRAQEEYGKLILTGARDAEQRVERLGSVAALEARKQVLATKQEMVSAAFDRAVELIAELPEDAYVALLADFAVNASSTGKERLVFSAADRARIGKAVCVKANSALNAAGKPAQLTLSEKTAAIKAGLILSNGDIEVNCSAEALVSQLRIEMASKVAAALFD